MNLTWHIVKKDLRAQKWPLLLWVLIIVAKLLVGVALLTASATINLDWLATSFARMAILAQVLAGLEGVSFVLVAAIIHEDLLVGTTAFWLTRPISGARLLCAKFLGIGLVFGVVPVLVTLPWWLGSGYGGREIVWAAAELLAVQAAFVLAGLLWSTVTDGFARFLMWTLVTLFAFPSIAAMVGAYISENSEKVKPTADLMWTRTFVEVVIAVIVILAVTIHQFLTRHTWRSVGLILSGVGLMIVTALWWPWNWEIDSKLGAWQAQRIAKLWPRGEEPAGLKFAVQSQVLPQGRNQRLRLGLEVAGLPAGQSLFPYNGEYELRWRDGSVERGWAYVRNATSLLPAAMQTPGHDWLEAGATREGSSDNRQQLQLDLSLSTGQLAHIRAEPPVFAPRVYLRVMKSTGAEKVAPQPGAAFKVGPTSERVAGAESETGGMMVAFVRCMPAIWPMGRDDSWRMYSQYRLINRSRGEALQGRQINLANARIATVSINFSIVGYDAPLPKSTLNPNNITKADRAAQMAWMRDAELYRENYIEERRFMHETKIDPLVLE